MQRGCSAELFDRVARVMIDRRLAPPIVLQFVLIFPFIERGDILSLFSGQTGCVRSNMDQIVYNYFPFPKHQ